MAKKSITYCPHCGQKLHITAAAVSSRGKYRKTATLQSSQRLHNITANALELPTNDWQKVTPVARLTTGDVTTSLYDAGISGLLVGIGTLGVCWYLEWRLIIAPAAGFAITLWRYFGGLSLAKSLLEIVETTTGRDINRDGQVGTEPEPPTPQTVRAEITTGPGQWQFKDLPGKPAALIALAIRWRDGQSFSERTAVDAGMTQEEFGKLRNFFFSEKWAAWKNPTSHRVGIDIFRPGRIILNALADTPLPDDLDHTQNILPSRTQQHAAQEEDI